MAADTMTSSSRNYRGECHRAGEYENYINALLADLQNSVPGHNQNLSSASNVHQTYGGTPGYGSLRTKPAPTQSPIYQQHRVGNDTRTTSPISNGSGLPSQSYQYHNQGSLPRSQNSLNRSTIPQNNSGNLSELDSLLQDLSNARYNSNLDKKEHVTSPSYNGKSSPSPYSNVSDSVKRPSVDSLLDELSNAHATNAVYAVPNLTPPSSAKLPTPGRHVTITVRETKTEKLTGPEGIPVSRIDEQITQQKDSYGSSAPPLNPICFVCNERIR